MVAIIWMIVIVSGFGVWLDADRYKITSADKVTWYQGGPVGWGLGTMLLWIAIFPTYLVARQRLIASAAQRSASEAAPAPTPAPAGFVASAADELWKLAELRDRGVLTEAEFQAHKAALQPPAGPGTF